MCGEPRDLAGVFQIRHAPARRDQRIEPRAGQHAGGEAAEFGFQIGIAHRMFKRAERAEYAALSKPLTGGITAAYEANPIDTLLDATNPFMSTDGAASDQ